jgi:hypothetical protein
MKSTFQILTLLAALFARVATVAAQPGQSEFPYQVPYELGTAKFAPGDNITITAVRGTRDVITTNETYCVEGTYTLSSKDKAQLGFYETVANSGPTPVDPRQVADITRGSGTFRLIQTTHELGYLHVSFYDGNGFGGVYFGQGEWVLRKSSSHANNRNPNHALFEYLGDPVAPPANLDPAYTKAGLSNIIDVAARNAGVTLKKIEMDDSEFPCLIGVVSEAGDFDKLEAQIRKLTGEFNGSVGSAACHAFNIVPWRAFPADAAQRIGRRLGVREEMLYDKLSAESQ